MKDYKIIKKRKLLNQTDEEALEKLEKEVKRCIENMNLIETYLKCKVVNKGDRK